MSSRKLLRFIGALSALALVLTLAGQAVQAATYTWDASGASGTPSFDGAGAWTLTGSNWWNGGSDQLWPNATDTALFGTGTSGSAAYTVTLGQVTNVGGLIFQNQDYAITGQTLNFAGTSPSITVNSGSASVSSVISGSNGLTVGGAGTLTLDAANIFTGGFTLKGATVVPNNNNAFGAGSGTLTLSGGSIFGNHSTPTISNPIYVTTGTTTNVFGFGNGGGFTGPITGSGTLLNNDSNGANTFIDGNISGFTGTISHNGGDNFQFQGTSAGGNFNGSQAHFVDNGSGGFLLFTGGATFQMGDLSGNGTSLYIVNGGTLQVGALNTSTTFSGNLNTSGGTAGLTKVGSGTLTLGGASSYVGSTTISGGAISIASASNLPASSPLTLSASSGLIATAGLTLANNVSIAAGDTGSLANANNTSMSLTGNYSGVAGTLVLDMRNNSGYNGFQINSANGPTGTVAMLATAGQQAQVAVNNSAYEAFFGNANVVLPSTGLVYLAAGNSSATNVSFGALNGGNSGTTLGFDNRSGDTFTINGITNGTFAGVIYNGGAAGANNLVKTGSATQVFTGANTYTGTTTISGGVLQLGTGGATGSLSANSAITDNATLAFNRGDNVNQTAISSSSGISGNGQLVQMGPGVLNLNAANSYAGGTTITGGTLNYATYNALPTAGNVTINGGVLNMADSSGNPYSGSTGTVMLVNGSITGPSSYLTAAGYNLQSGAVSAVLSGGTSALVKTTLGLVTLTANNNYGGVTTVSAGTLALGAAGTLGSGNATVSPGGVLDVSAYGSGGYTFGGQMLTAGRTGPAATDVNGSLNVNYATISVAGGSNSGTLSINGGLSFADGTLVVGQGGSVALTGALTLAGIDYVDPTVALSSGTYNLFTFGSLASGDTSDLAMTGANGSNARQSYTFGISGGTAITLTVAGQAGNLVWTGGSSGIWDTTNHASWYNVTSGSADVFYTGDALTFNDSAGTANLVNIAGGGSGFVDPGSLTVSNTAVNFTFTGAGSIGGATSLLKSGPGTLTIDNANSYTGGTNVTGGVINANAASALGSGPVTVSSGALNDGAAQSFGAGALIVNGGTVNASNAQSIASASLTAGLLNINNSSALGTGSVTISGGSIDSTAGGVVLAGNPLAWSGNFTFVGSNPLDLGSGGVTMSSSVAVTVTASTLSVDGPVGNGGNTLAIAGAGSALFNGPISGGGGLTVAGPGMTVLAGSNSYSGATNVSGGTLQVGTGGSGASIGGTSAVNLSNNSNLVFNHSDAISLNAAIGGAGNLLQTGGGTLALGGANSYSGTTTVVGGAISISSAANLPASSPLTLSAGGGVIATGGLTLANNVAVAAGDTGFLANANNTNMALTGNYSGVAGTLILNMQSNSGYNGFQINSANGPTGTVEMLATAGQQAQVGVNNAAYQGFFGNANVVLPASGEIYIAAGNSSATNVSFGALNGGNSGTILGFDNHSNSTFTINGITDGTFAGVIYNGGGAGPNNLVKTGSATQAFTGANTYTGTTTINGGVLQIGAGGTTGSISSASAITDNATLAFNRSDNYGGAFSNSIAGSGGLTVSAGSLVLGGAVSYTGQTAVAGGALTTSNLTSSTAPLALGSAAGVGTLNYAGTSIVQTAGLTINAGGGQINVANGGQTLTFNTGAITASGPLTLSGAGNVTFASSLPAGLTSLDVASNGAVVLAGNNAYTGATSVNSGKLYLDGTNATGSIAVAGGASLGGAGSAASATANVANGGILDLSQNTGGTFVLGGLNFLGSGTLSVNDSASRYSAVPAMSAGTLSTASSPVSLYVSNVPTGSGTMEILQYSGAIGGSGSSAFTLASPVDSGRSLYTLSSSGGVLDLHYSVDYPYWTGAGNGSWDATSTGNWKLESNNAATTYIAGDNVLFDDRAVNPVVTLSAANVSPGSVTFSNTAESYTLQGSYGIVGSGSLLVNGAGLVTIANSNGYTGGTTLNSGTLSFANGALGSGNITFAGNATLQYNGSNTQDISSQLVINGPATATIDTQGNNVTFATGFGGGSYGSLVKAGSGTLTLTASNGYTGLTVVNNGTLQLGTGYYGFDGSIAGNVVNNAALVFDLYGNQTFAGNISGSGSLANSGQATLTLAGSNSYSGATALNAGAVSIASPANLPAASNLTFNGGTLIATAGMTLANNVAVPAGQTGTIQQSAGITVNVTGDYSAASGTLTFDGSAGGDTINIQSANGPAPGSVVNFITGNSFSQISVNNAAYEAFFANAEFTVTGGGANSYVLALGNGGSGHNVQVGALNGGNNTSEIASDNASTTLTINGVTAGNWAGDIINGSGGQIAVVKTGTATQAFSGVNSYTGGTTIEGGVLQYFASNVLPANGAVAVSGGTLDLYIFSGTVGAVSLNGGAITGQYGTLTASSYAVQSGTISVAIGGSSASLVQSGSGMTVLSGYNTYSGGSTVAGGTLQLGTPAALGTGGLAVNAGVLDLDGNGVTVPSFSGAAGTVTNSGGNDVILTVNQSTTTTFGGAITDGPTNKVGLMLEGDGTLVLSGAANTYTGGTTVAAGTLIVTNDEALADGSNLLVGSPSDFGLVLPDAASSATAAPSLAPVPEPGTLALFLACAAAMGFGLWRRRSIEK